MFLLVLSFTIVFLDSVSLYPRWVDYRLEASQDALAQTGVLSNYPLGIQQVGFEEEQRICELFKKIYSPFILLYDYTGIVGCILVGACSILLCLMGIAVFQGKLRMFFLCFLVYLLGPLIFYIWAYVLPGRFFY